MVLLIIPVLFSYILRKTAIANTNVHNTNEFILFDFTDRQQNVSGWIECSDTVREVGMSKATITLQATKLFQRAIFFALLNPQPNGAGFAGVKYESSWNLTNYNSLSIRLRSTGQINNYKIILRHRNQNREPYPTYELTFEAFNEFSTLILPLDDFKPYYRGRRMNESDVGALDKSFVTSFGMQVAGGVYLPNKQAGVTSLEIDWIKAIE